MAEKTTKEAVVDCNNSLAELRALLQGKNPQEEILRTVDDLMDIMGLKDKPAKRSAENY